MRTINSVTIIGLDLAQNQESSIAKVIVKLTAMAIEVATITTKAMAIEVEVAKLIIEAAFIMAITTTAAAATTVTDFRRKFKVATVIFNFSLAMVMVVPSIRAID